MKRQLGFVIAVFLAMATPAWPQSPSCATQAPSPSVAAIIAKTATLVQAGSYERAVTLLTQQLKAKPDAADRAALNASLSDAQYAWGNHLNDSSDFAGTVDHLQQAYALDNGLRPKQSEQDLGCIGIAYASLGQFPEALDYEQKSLAGAKQIGDDRTVEKDLGNIGIVYENLGQHFKALDYEQQSLSAAKQMADKEQQASALTNIGVAYENLGQYSLALDSDQQALALDRQIEDHKGEEMCLDNIGTLYDDLGQYSKAIDYEQQALTLDRQVGDKEDEEHGLGNIGIVYEELGQHSKALEYDRQSLSLARQVGDRQAEEEDLSNIANVYEELGRYSQALDYEQQALSLAKRIADVQAVEEDFSNIANVYEDLGQYAQAITNFNLALESQRAIGDRQSEGSTLSNLMMLHKKLDHKSLAIFYGKQAVNNYQSIRKDMGTGKEALDLSLQQSYLKTIEPSYRRLADLLIGRGRLAEAEQVLAMLKQQEYFDFIGQDRAAAGGLTDTVAFTPDEQKWMNAYDSLGQTVQQLQEQVDALAKAGKQSTEDYKLTSNKLTMGQEAFDEFLTDLPKRFSDTARGSERASAIDADSSMEDLLADLRDQQHLRVAAIYTVEADNQYAVILATPGGRRPGLYPISSADLNARVEQFREVLTNPSLDPRPLGQELYHILVGPIAKDLESYHPQVVMWSLDGPLELVPVAALWDGHEYLVQRWQNTLFNASSLPHFDQSADRSRWVNALGFGVTQPRSVGSLSFNSLTHVKEELAEVIKNPEEPSQGALPGRYYLDDQFKTDDAIALLRAGAHPVVHIASHFYLSPAGAASSFLLTGDGTLSLDTLRHEGQLFRSVDLLTLSACSTAVGVGPAGSDQLNSMDATAQLLGARAIVATLWNVSDASTSDLMASYYRRLANDPTITKSEALREAQLELAGLPDLASPFSEEPSKPSGEAKSKNNQPAPETDRGFGPLGKVATSAPAYTPDPSKPYAHPYYWAPFVLMGNWR